MHNFITMKKIVAHFFAMYPLKQNGDNKSFFKGIEEDSVADMQIASRSPSPTGSRLNHRISIPSKGSSELSVVSGELTPAFSRSQSMCIA